MYTEARCTYIGVGNLALLACLFLIACDTGVSINKREEPIILPGSTSAGPPTLFPVREILGKEAVSGSFRGVPGSSVSIETSISGSVTSVNASITGDSTDLYVTHELPNSDQVRLKWMVPTDGFVRAAFQQGTTLHVGICGIRTALGTRNSLSGTCSLYALDTNGIKLDSTWHTPPSRLSSSLSFSAPPTVVAVDNTSYKVAWAGNMPGDYDQNGVVGLTDLTPLAAFFNSNRPVGQPWPFDFLARVDGDNNGEINLADLTTIGANFGATLTGFKVERAAGQPVPESWTTIEETLAVSEVDFQNQPLTPLGPSRYQTLLDEVLPGWTYYRVSLLFDETELSNPSEPRLAPDITPPTWPNGDQLARVEYPDSREFSFANAVDDRDAEVAYALTVAALDGEDRVPLFVFDADTSPEPVTSPYVADDHFFNGSPFLIPYVGGSTYWVCVTSRDSNGNESHSDWMSFVPDSGEPIGSGPAFLDQSWDLWVSKQGDVKCTPPAFVYLGGTDLSAEILSLSLPIGEFPGGDYSDITEEDFLAGQSQSYGGGEVVFSNAIQKGEWLFVALKLSNSTGQKAFSYAYIRFPIAWLTALTAFSDFKDVQNKPLYLPSGEVALSYWATLTDNSQLPPYWLTSMSSSWLMTNSAPLAWDPNIGQAVMSAGLTTNVVLFIKPISPVSGHLLSWFSPSDGLLTQVEIPEGDFEYGPFGSTEVLRWAAEDADTAIGALSRVKENTQGELCFEVWEAHKDGTFGVRELLPLPELQDDSTVIATYNLGLDTVYEYYPDSSSTSFETRFAVYRAEGGFWTSFDQQELPQALDQTGWDELSVADYEIASPYSHIYVTGSRASNSIHYHGVFRGDAREGFENFTPLWESDENGVIDSGKPSIKGRALIAVNAYGYLVRGSQGELVASLPDQFTDIVVNQSGRMTAYKEWELGHDSLAGYNFERFSFYWHNGQARGGIAKAKLSADGLWMSPGPGGSWGIASLLP